MRGGLLTTPTGTPRHACLPIDKSSSCVHGPLVAKLVGWRLKPHSSIGVIKCHENQSLINGQPVVANKL